MATGSPIAMPSAFKTLTNQFPVRVVAEKQKQTLIVTVLPIASRNIPRLRKEKKALSVSVAVE
jgi:hypothetical protein